MCGTFLVIITEFLENPPKKPIDYTRNITLVFSRLRAVFGNVSIGIIIGVSIGVVITSAFKISPKYIDK